MIESSAPGLSAEPVESELYSGHSHDHGHEHHMTDLVADRRGLTAFGGAAIAIGLGLLGAIIDVTSGEGLRGTFTVLFIAGCVISALLVHAEDLMAAVIMPPLVYLGLAFVGTALDGSKVSGGWFKQQTVEMGSALVLGAPTLLIASAASVLIALVRYRASVRSR